MLWNSRLPRLSLHNYYNFGHSGDPIENCRIISKSYLSGALISNQWMNTLNSREGLLGQCRESMNWWIGIVGVWQLWLGNSLHPGLYHAALESSKYYLFTGGGSVLKVLEEGDPYALPTVKALIENGKTYNNNKKLQQHDQSNYSNY